MAKSEQSADIVVRRVSGDEGVWARVSTSGPEGKRAFVLVSGIGVSSHYFEQLAPHLLQYGPVHALDLPGFGGVPHAKRAMSIREFADLVGRAIDELGLEDPVVVGHSMGTQVCADLAVQRPELSTLVLISPVIDDGARSLRLQAVRFLRSSLHEPFRVTVLALIAYVNCGFGWFFKILPRMMTYRIEDTAGHIRTPTLIIRGERDAVSPRSWVTRLAQAFPHAETVEIEGAAHSVMHAHAREVAELCVRFAEGTLDGRGLAATEEGLLVAPELPEEDSSLGPVEAVRAFVAEAEGVGVELAGNHADDDELVERGRRQQTEARRRGQD